MTIRKLSPTESGYGTTTVQHGSVLNPQTSGFPAVRGSSGGIVVTLLVVGLGALALVPLLDINGETRRVGRLLFVALIALNGVLMMYAAPHIDGSDDETEAE